MTVAVLPGDVLVTRSGGLAGAMIRLGAALKDQLNLSNHVAVVDHADASGTLWCVEGRPGGVGWRDAKAYLASPWTVTNAGQPKTADQRKTVCDTMTAMIGTAYDWQAIADDTLRAFHMDDLFSSTINGSVPGHVVCSSFAAFLYKTYGWDHPNVPDRDCEPGDWTAFDLAHGWNVKLTAP